MRASHHSVRTDTANFKDGLKPEMPLQWKWRHTESGNQERHNSAPSVSGQTDAPDVVLLSRRHWAINAEREALNEAVTLVDTLLGRDADAPRRRCTSLELLQAMSRARTAVSEDIAPLSTEERRASVETLFLRTSWDDLCRRRSAHLDVDAAVVGSGRLRRQNALCGRAHSRWRCREDNDMQGHLATDQGTSPTEILKRLPRSSQQRVAMYDDPLAGSPCRAARARLCRVFCRDILDSESPAEKLTTPASNQGLPNDDTTPDEIHPTKEATTASSTNVDNTPGPPNPQTESTEQKDKDNELEDVIRNQLECPVCLDYLCPPIKQCANGHCVCSSCSPRLSHCATCRASFISTSNIVLENLVRSLFFPCRYREAGCTEVLKMEQRPGHEEVCLFRPRRCPTACCDWQGLPGQLKSHITSSHQHFTMKLNELREFSFCVDRNDGVPTIVHDEQFVIFVDTETFVFESHYDLWRSKFFAELRRFEGDGKTAGSSEGDRQRYAYDVELYTANKNVHLKLRNLVDDENRRSPTAIKIDLDVFNHFVSSGHYTLYMRILLIKEQCE